MIKQIIAAPENLYAVFEIQDGDYSYEEAVKILCIGLNDKGIIKPLIIMPKWNDFKDPRDLKSFVRIEQRR